MTPLNPVLPLRECPLVLGLEMKGTELRALCLSPLTVLDAQVLGAERLVGTHELQRFWTQVVMDGLCLHQCLVVAVPRTWSPTEDVTQWLQGQGITPESHPAAAAQEDLEVELASLGLPPEFASAFCVARTAIYRRLGAQVASHLWLEMLRLQDEFGATQTRLRRLMLALLDTGPPQELAPIPY